MTVRARSPFMASREGGAVRPCRWLPALLVALPICALANNASAFPSAPGAEAIARATSVAGSALHPFSAAAGTATPLADSQDQDSRNTPRRWYRDNQGDRGQRGGNGSEQRNRFEERRRFEALPPNQQQRLIQTRERFLSLPPETRDRLRQRWQQMSPDDRRRWRESESHRD